jgi:hypothetical protein
MVKTQTKKILRRQVGSKAQLANRIQPSVPHSITSCCRDTKVKPKYLMDKARIKVKEPHHLATEILFTRTEQALKNKQRRCSKTKASLRLTGLEISRFVNLMIFRGRVVYRQL